MRKYFDKAGALIVREVSGQLEILLEYRERKYLKDWSFPKGGIEKGETPKEAAKREIREETGLVVELIKKLPTIYYHNDYDGDVRQYMFLARPLSGDIHAEFPRDKVEWVPFNDVTERLSYQNLKDYFESMQDELLILN